MGGSLRSPAVWRPLAFGQYDGLTAPQVMFRDPDWAYWAVEHIRPHPVHPCDLPLVCRRGRAIRIPACHPGMVAQYAVDPLRGTFEGLHLIPREMPREHNTIVRDVIDMAVPHELRFYDKGGYKIFLRDLKRIVFGDPRIRIAKERAERFFADEGNFHVSHSGQVSQ